MAEINMPWQYMSLLARYRLTLTRTSYGWKMKTHVCSHRHQNQGGGMLVGAYPPPPTVFANSNITILLFFGLSKFLMFSTPALPTFNLLLMPLSTCIFHLANYDLCIMVYTPTNDIPSGLHDFNVKILGLYVSQFMYHCFWTPF